MAMRPAKTDDTQTDLAVVRSRIRDDAQKELDTDVAALITEWKDAGSPATGIPNRRYEVDDVAEAKRRVNRSFTLASKELTPKLAPMWFKDGAKDSDGFVAIKFSVRESIPSNQSEPATDGETPAPDAETPAPDAETPAPDAETPAPDGEGETDAGRRRSRFAGRA
jgi:cation diffusion facilitator CzcD-associated flavoprotein CzcO